MPDDFLQQTDQAGATVTLRAKEINGVKHPGIIPMKPSDGTPIEAASESAVAAVAAAVAAVEAKLSADPSTSAKQDDTVAALVTLIAQAATEATLAAIAAATGDEDAPSTNGRKGIVILAVRQDADTTGVSADGDLSMLKMDEDGRLKVASKPASYPDITGDITAVQATIGTPVAGGTVEGSVSRASNVMAFCTGAFSTINCAFEGSMEASGDTNWFGVQAVRSNANTVETTTGNLSAQPVYAWELSVNALKRVRVRCTARTSGTQSWRFVLGTYATEPIPATQVSGTQPVSFTQPALVAGTAAIGDVGQQYRANATGAASRFHRVSTGTDSVSVKASAGRLIGWRCSNHTAAWKFVKLHNQTTAPTPGTGVVETIPIPPNGIAEGAREGGIGFSTGIGLSIVADAADAGTTAVAASDVIVDLQFA